MEHSMPRSADHDGSDGLLVRAKAALDRNDATTAAELIAEVLRRQPFLSDAHYVAGMAAQSLGQLSLALQHLHQAASLPPRRASYIIEFSKALLRIGNRGEALRAANGAIALVHDDALALSTLGLVYNQCHAHERAAAAFRRAAAILPDSAACRFNVAMSLAFGGANAAAITELEACLALDPACWPAHALLSRLARQTSSSNHVVRLRGLLDSAHGNQAALVTLHTALGKEHEDIGEYDRAFDHFVAAKAAARPAYASSRDEATARALQEAFPAAREPAAGFPTREPIFVFGMPRSGTTLVERILASHPEVHAAGELDEFHATLEHMLPGSPASVLDPARIALAGSLDWSTLGERYLAATRPQTSLKPRFVDKLPHNFLFAGFIANALPHARMICLRRNPLDTCLGNLREPFSPGSPFHGYSFDLLDIGRYYVLHDRLMAHWRKVMPGRILEIDYETLVTSQATVTRQLLDHCGLPWNESCLHFDRNPAPTTTASALQVREPLHRSALQRWRHYAPQLTALRQLLTDAGVDCDEKPSAGPTPTS
jgi:Flp pilus assembly protein TadD